SDTGGSIRQPASFCGVVGLKPTYGLVSRYGLVAYASSLDQIGPLAPTVEDAAIFLQAIAGYDPRDSTSLNVEIPDYSKALLPSLDRRSKRRIGVIKETFGDGLDPVVEAAVEKAIQQLQDLGAEIEVISCPQFRYGLPTYYIIAPSEASSNLARYDGVKYGIRKDDTSLMSMYTKTRAEGFGEEVKRRIMIGTYALSAGYYDAYYLKAQKVRTLIKQDFERAFAQVDVLVCPTSPTTAFKAGDKVDDPISMYLSDLMTIPVNLAGLPGMSLPCGFDEQGMPIGLQLISNVLREDLLFEVGYAYEQATGWHKRTPILE
ncbi:MAG: Asp-tRNA(Asn)/Glu-tRNA(Gln) amidotransferase subunit GatA, partial [Cyanobacteria bacterium Co-bin13]|nr:Asp-tRNA(Asn)/Glu-tRNA(Gln) amidotransferase subunit GatA [Cyanobacteria bacterium Co-bin13]